MGVVVVASGSSPSAYIRGHSDHLGQFYESSLGSLVTSEAWSKDWPRCSECIRGLIRRIDRGDPNDIRGSHSEHLGQSLDQASDVCRRNNMLRKLTCIAGSSYSSAALNEITPQSFKISADNRFDWKHILSNDCKSIYCSINGIHLPNQWIFLVSKLSGNFLSKFR